MSSDNHLMIAVKNGQIQQMSLLFDRYHKKLFGFFWHCTSDRDQSEDLVQTVFYRMIKYRLSFDDKKVFKTWMYTLAKNALNDDYKSQQKLGQRQDTETLMNHSVQAKESHEDLHLALTKLSQDQREILLLSRFEELPNKEIAEILGISEANVKVKIHRAMKELKEIYLKMNGHGRAV